MADRDQAIKHVLQSAFGHSGQKCSATSLLLLEDEVFHDEAFRATLVDAAKSLKVGSAWDTSNRMGPMIAPPMGDLNQALKELEISNAIPKENQEKLDFTFQNKESESIE